MIDHIIWDWNGTLLNDVSFGYRLANWLLSQYDLPQIQDLHTYRRIFTFPVREYYRTIGFGDDIFPEVAVKWMNKYMAEEHECPLQPGALEVTRLFREKGLRQVIISASKLENLKFQLAERPESTVFIGDTLHDYDVAQAIGCRCILVEGGHQLPETLKNSGAIVAKSLPHAAEIILSMG